MLPVVLCIDVEPDGPGHLVAPSAGPWSGFLATHRWLDAQRSRIEDLTGAPPVFSWFLRMDPQIAEVTGSARHALDAHPEAVADLRRRKEPLGLHIHGWRRTTGGGWIDDFADADWLGHCVDTSFAAFAEATGTPCRLSRVGMRFFDDATARRLARAGAVVDLTLEPANDRVTSGTRPAIIGDLPDCRRTPRRPHLVAPGLVELPLSASSRRKGWRPRRHLSRLRHHGVGQRLDLPVQLGRRVADDDGFADQVRRTLRHQQPPYLAYALRSDGLLLPERRERIESHMEALVAAVAERGGAFVGPEVAVATLGDV